MFGLRALTQFMSLIGDPIGRLETAKDLPKFSASLRERKVHRSRIGVLITADYEICAEVLKSPNWRTYLEPRNFLEKSFIEKLETSAEVAMLSIANLAAEKDAMSFLFECKFNQSGFNPLDSSIKLNLIEQLNQTFTYLASFKGAEYIFLHHKKVNFMILRINISG